MQIDDIWFAHRINRRTCGQMEMGHVFRPVVLEGPDWFLETSECGPVLCIESSGRMSEFDKGCAECGFGEKCVCAESEKGDDSDKETETKKKRTRKLHFPVGEKYVTATFMRIMKTMRDDMIAAKKKYEEAYWTARNMDDENNTNYKFFVSNIGRPDEKDSAPTKPKICKTLVGTSKDAIKNVLNEHNDPLAVRRNPKTRNGVRRWNLFLIVFLPLAWDESKRIILKFWSSGHGLENKLKRGFEIIRMFNLRYYIPPDVRDYVQRTMARREITLPPETGNPSGNFV